VAGVAGINEGQGILVEGVLSFILVFVIFGTAVDSKGHGTIAPLCIGFAVLIDHLMGRFSAQSPVDVD
jgi:glycerol uptake facilitator-like aquaporin